MDENIPPMQQPNIIQRSPPETDDLVKCIVIGGGTASLQDSFHKFRKQKVKERKILQKCRDEISECGPRTEEYKAQLRQKFIDQAKKYIGVPYAERFKAPDAPIAPLYLDCCALVRKCVQDLQEEFGFVIGKWNQCYQLDTLPVVLEQSQLKPGDLIFYEGIYNSNKSKPQKHNNVHVEIFLGGETGEGTIGSRFHKGNVSIFPSFKFKSTTWDLVQYHFRSLDPWLEGSCKSCCPEHAWLSDTLAIAAAAGRRSIFNDVSDDESAGGGEDVDDYEVQGGGDEDGACSSAATDAVPFTTETPSEVAETIEGLDDEAATEMSTSERDAVGTVERTCIAESTTEIPISTAASSLAESSTLTPSKSNTPQRATPAKGQRVSGKVPAPLQPSPSKTNPSARRSSDSLVTSSCSSKASKAAPISQARRAPRLSASVDTLDPTNADGSSPPHTYYVGNTNGWKLVKAAMDKRGWQQLPFEYQFSSRFGLKWVERRSQIDYRAHVPGQLVCHIPNSEIITTKVGLLQSLRDTFCKVAPGAPRRKTPWLPETYILDSPSDVTFLMTANTQAASKDGRDPIWIYKPSCNNRGRGIRVVSGVEALNEICYGKDTGSPESSIPKSTGILQRYIEKPLLVPRAGEGFKFDYRCYMLVARNHPSYIALFHPGYCRLTLKPYSDSLESLSDATIHLTNAAVQKKDPLYEDNKDFQIQSVESVAALIEQAGDPRGAAFLRADLDTQVKRCMVDVLRSSTPKFLRKQGFFDMFGLDFMVTQDCKLLLLEVNTNPALSLDNAVLEALLPVVVDGALELVLGSQGPDRTPTATDETMLANLPGQWQLLLDEAGKFEFSAPAV